ncbi:probable inactive heme oxygenase 2, chloroplastic [Salvia miltiorrhiza]|uniref:probable inactive heme oxygenase 2, chloroplastic n=1 Tax=Salvia miltiorrhiza TaxID=226208 RepID=UPI0025AC277C|nr:probable inactive heme oxygenase 2, chloroplastic [Salvia miltiorrhiza]XP_057786294.1 probable inactive heme oxygenase 2, chloroplastic [Salvia miltiorrhiza]
MSAKMAYFPSLNPSASLNFVKSRSPRLFVKSYLAPTMNAEKILRNGRLQRNPFVLQCTKFSALASASETESDYETEEVEEYSDEEEGPPPNGQTPSPVKRRRRRYRKQYPGEVNGITEEMRFVAMKLRNNGKPKSRRASSVGSKRDGEDLKIESEKGGNNGEAWQPSIEGFMKYLVDTKLVFTTVERIVDESTDVSYVYFRRTGLERADRISRDLEWLREQGNEIPEPSNPGATYVQHLEELAEKSPPLFLCHFYNIYFSHIAGGQVISRKVSDMLFGGRELEIYKWDGDAEELLRGVREKLNALGEHWSRDEKNRCLRETTKAFRFLGQIVRLIIL